MEKRTTSFVSSKLEVRSNPAKGNYGLFARDAIAEGELVICWAGYVATTEEFEQLSAFEREHSVQIEEDLYQVPYGQAHDPGDYVNHSCDPNLGLSSSISLIALRDIRPDEEVCFDYAMTDSTPYDEFTCGCGTDLCRGIVTGSDWQLPTLQQRYDGFFSPYLQRRINRHKKDKEVNEVVFL
ncbi:MAG: SET domain-containing protein [Anaerolineales bacterium]|nr:SET domain-containing protein [Anaerolineales bacterium]MCB8938192.1 SET domain-containing protein [Ardenticatenaceae bacterium]